MKRALSMLLAIAMILSMVPSVFAASETATVIEDISEFEVTLNADNDYYAEFAWTPAEDGELSLYQYTDAAIEVMMTQGDNYATNYFEEDESYSFATSMAVVAGEEVLIAIANSVEEDQVFSVYGDFVGKQGSENNPVFLNDGSFAYTVENTGTMWYAGYYTGAMLKVTGEAECTVTVNGADYGLGVEIPMTSSNPMEPCKFALTGEGTFQVEFIYPVGDMNNPAALCVGEAANTILAANQEVYYTWIATAYGDLSITMPDDFTWSYTINNLTTYEYGDIQSSDSVDPAYCVTVNEGDEIQVIVNAQFEGERDFTATLTEKEYVPSGTPENPEVLEDISMFYAELEAGDEDGYFFQWTAPASGEAVLNLNCYDDGVVCDAIITHELDEVKEWRFSEAAVDGALTMNVEAGAKVTIVMVAPTKYVVDDMGNVSEEVETTFPATTIYANMKLVNGTAEYPYALTPAEIPGSVSTQEIGSNSSYTYSVEMGGVWATFANAQDIQITYNDTVYEASESGIIEIFLEELNYFAGITANLLQISNVGETAKACTMSVAYPVGHPENPENLFRPNYIQVNIAEGNEQGYYYQWTANADGTLKLTCPTVEGVAYNVVLTNMSSYAMAWLSDSTDGTVSVDVKAGDVVKIQINTEPDENWNYPALEVALTGEFIFPVGTQMNPEVIFRPNYIGVNIAEGNNQGYYYKWMANADGTLKLTCPAVEGVAYDVNMTNMSTYAQAWLVDSTDGTISLDVKRGDEVIIQVAAIPDASWNIPALTTALTGEFIFPVGSQMNPEILFRPNYIGVNIAEGNNQGYYYKWTANADGTLKLTCPAVEGVAYDVNMTNMSTYAQAWLVDSTDGTISLDVKQGDEVIIQVAAIPDASWNIPALTTALTGEFIFPVGSQMNPEVLESLSWYYGEVAQLQGDTDGYYYTYTVPADGDCVFYFGFNEGLENYVLDIIVTNQNTYAQKSLLNDGVDNNGMELQLAVKEGEVLQIQVVAIQDAEGNYAPAATMTWCGNFTYPVGTEENPVIIEWAWDDAYTNATASVTVAAGETVYFNGTAGMILTVDGVETAMSETGVFSITNNSEAEATYGVALATPVGAYNNPEVIEDATNFQDSNSLKADESYYYIWTATEDSKVVLDVTEGANITVDCLTYTADSEWPISEQFVLAEPEIDENWNYTGWIVAENLVIDVKAGQQLKIQVNGLTDWTNWTTPAVDYTLSITAEKVVANGITKQPENQLTGYKETAQFTVEAVGAVAYKWQYSRDGVKWTNTTLTGYNTATLNVAMITSRNGYQYRCAVTFEDGTVQYSDAATLTMDAQVEITGAPADCTALEGSFAPFTVEATDVLSYRWYYRRNAEDSWHTTTMKGYVTNTLQVLVLPNRDGYQYRCKITGLDGSITYTEPATLHVAKVILTQPTNIAGVIGETAEFHVDVQNVKEIQWLYRKTPENPWGDTNMEGNKTDTLKVAVTAARKGYQYMAKLINNDGSILYTNEVTLYLAPIVTTHPEDVTVVAGQVATFTVVADETLTYQWQYRRDGINWTNTSAAGNTTETLNVTTKISNNGYQYRCKLTGAEGSVQYTDAATLTVTAE